jgi:hypothetical protein
VKRNRDGMAIKHKNLYLYLTLACFVGIILIFIFDGYMGLYDSLSVTGVDFPQKITNDQWQQQDRYGVSVMNIGGGGDVPFSYEVDNRLFSSYKADINVSLWHDQAKVADLQSKTLTLGAFDKGQVDWVLNIDDFVPENLPAGTNYDFTVVIKRGEIERRVILYVSPDVFLPKPIVIPES